MTALYQLTGLYKTLQEQADDETIDVPNLLATLVSVEDQIQEKSISVAKLVQNLDSTAGAIKDAIARMEARRKALESRSDSIKKYVLSCMLAAGIHKLECAEFKISVRNNPSRVVVTDEASVPLSYFRQPAIPEPVLDKKKIADDIKAGCVVEGVHLEESQRLEIK